MIPSVPNSEKVFQKSDEYLGCGAKEYVVLLLVVVLLLYEMPLFGLLSGETFYYSHRRGGLHLRSASSDRCCNVEVRGTM